MKLLKKIIHPAVKNPDGTILKRRAARAIVLDGENILLLYTKRYNDYSFPGGGVEEHEDLIEGLCRELNEETGAQNIKVIKPYGLVDELRPHYKPEYDLMHMLSYFYVCEIDATLGQVQFEHYEIANGMQVKWINVYEAIAHNRSVIEAKESSMGLSIERETLILEMVAKDLL